MYLIKLFTLSRKYIFVYYVPSSMFTVTSWVSHLLPPTSYPARTSLLVTVFLCQIGILTSALQDTPSYDEGKYMQATYTYLLPKFCVILLNPGMTSLEEWCFACFVFTFTTLVTYVIILIRMVYRSLLLNSVEPDNKVQKNQDWKSDMYLEIFLFSCSAFGFSAFNVYYWLF